MKNLADHSFCFSGLVAQVQELQAEVDQLREVLVDKYMQVADNLEGERDCVSIKHHAVFKHIELW